MNQLTNSMIILEGDGNGNSQPSIQSILNRSEVKAVGLTGKHQITRTITVPSGKKLFSLGYHGSVRNTLRNNGMLDQDGVIIANTGNNPAIKMQTAAMIENLFIHRAGITFTQGKTCNYSGLAVDASNASDVLIQDGLITGFHQAVKAHRSERFTVRGLKGDCTNGINVKEATDVARLIDCHFWSFGSISNANQEGCNGPFGPKSHALRREGFAFHIEKRCDWIQMRGCFSYGYWFGLLIIDPSQPVITDCGFDNINIPGYPVGSSDHGGVGVFGGSGRDRVRFSGVSVAAQQNAFTFGTLAGISMSQCNVWDCRDNGVIANRAKVKESMCEIDRVPTPWKQLNGGRITHVR